MFSKFFSRSSGRRKPISYDEAKTLAREGDEESRAELAERDDLAPEILYFLAEDPSPRVRRSIASNESAPRPADLLLAKDRDEDVRGSLAEKIARLAPGTGPDEQDRLRRMTYEALELLAKDQAVRIRQTLAETLKEVADAPPDVIRRLAWDVEAAVATPVLRFSPVLSDEDLVEIIRAKPSPGAVEAVSQRDGVSETVSDAIVESDEETAIALLLGNASAQIREETLDRVIARAVDVDLWHEPLAMRPRLPSKAAVKVARFVAADILNRMVERDDLNAEALAAVKAVVDKRLGDGEAVAPERTTGAPGGRQTVQVDDHDAFDEAMRLWSKGELDEDALLRAMHDDRRDFAMAVIAVMANVPLKTVRTACERKSAKGCVALVWRAGLTAGTAEIVQQKLARIAPKEILRARGGRYPLGDEELAWQLEFISGL